MPDRNDRTDVHLVQSIFELQERCHRLVESVSEIQNRGRGMELILALLLGRILDNQADRSIIDDCLSMLDEMRHPERDSQLTAFPDPRLLEDVIAILSGEERPPWRPRVLAGGKRD